jgi:hypothetical protein
MPIFIILDKNTKKRETKDENNDKEYKEQKD